MKKIFIILFNLQNDLNREFANFLDDLKEILITLLNNEEDLKNVGVGEFYYIDNLIYFKTWNEIPKKIISKFENKTELNFERIEETEEGYTYYFVYKFGFFI